MNGGMIRLVEVDVLTQDISYSEWWEYVTSQGETFDSIAMEFYGDETLSSEIIKENPHYADVLIFDAGVTLYVPVTDNIIDTSEKPPWERS